MILNAPTSTPMPAVATYSTAFSIAIHRHSTASVRRLAVETMDRSMSTIRGDLRTPPRRRRMYGDLHLTLRDMIQAAVDYRIYGD